MVLPHQSIINVLTTLLIFWVQTSTLQARSSKALCPIGFSLAYTKHERPICYRQKGPEAFRDKFKDCAGNLYTSKLYHSLNFLKPSAPVWTEYKSMYPGGPFVDWSYTELTGRVLPTTYNVTYDSSYGIDEELCVVIDPVSNFTATRCDEKHYRYCFIRPYDDADDMTRVGCEKLKDSWRFYSPTPTCLSAVTGAGGGTVRATWNQSLELLCGKRGGSLLNRGWRYANNPLIQEPGTHPMYPLGVVLGFNSNHTLRSLHTDRGIAMSSLSEWTLASDDINSETPLGALQDGFLHFINESFIFYDVLCERSIDLEYVSLNITVNSDNKLILSVNATVDEDDIYCFTDSETYYPTSVSKKYDEDEAVFKLKPTNDGYYYCVLVDSKNFHVTESNKALYIEKKKNVYSTYAIKIVNEAVYKFDSFEKTFWLWKKKLKNYIYYRTKFVQLNGESELGDPDTAEKVLKDFKNSISVDSDEKDVIDKLKVKRLYMDARTALVHVAISSDMMPVAPGVWDGLEVVYMKPVYLCKGFRDIPSLPLGSSHSTSKCQTYSCVGNYNEGVQWLLTATEGCYYAPPVEITQRIYLPVEEVMPTSVPILIPSTGAERFNAKPLLSTEETELNAMFFQDNTTTMNTNDSFTTEYSPTTEDSYTTEGGFTTEDEFSTEDYTAENGTDDCSDETTEFITETNTPCDTQTWTIPPTNTESTVPFIPPTPPHPLPPHPLPPHPIPCPILPCPPIVEPPITAIPIFPTTIIPPLPEEQLQQVLDDLTSLVNNDTAPVFVESIDEAFNQVDGLLEAEEDLEIPSELLHLLDQLGNRVDLNGSHVASSVRNNIALLMADAEPENPVRGLRIAARSEEAFTDDAFEIITDSINSTHLQADQNEAVVTLPESVAGSTRRISFVVFRTDRAFQNTEGSTYQVNSRVLSINVENLTRFEHGEVVDIHLSPMTQDPDRNQSRACAYWHFFENGTGYWSQDGCTFIRATRPGMLDTCRCDHLTHFAEILVPRTVFSERNENILEIISIVGCCLSIFGLILVGLTAMLFRSWRRDYSNKIWLQLCIAIFILAICFLIIVFAKFEHYDVPCMLVGVALHYSVLASFCWMLVAAVLSYRRLVLVFTRDASHKLLRASAFSWGAPCAVVGVLLSVDPHSYAGRFEEMTPSGGFCYPSGLGLWLAVYAPIAIMLLANWTLFILIVRSVFASRRIQRHGDSNEALRCASVSCLLVFLFGLPWIFGLFGYNIVAAYLFTLTATFQGFVLFLFFVCGNKKTRDLWLNKLKIKQTRKVPVTSSTYTNRSTGPGWRAGTEASSSMEAKSSKPRSLSSRDDSRFS